MVCHCITAAYHGTPKVCHYITAANHDTQLLDFFAEVIDTYDTDSNKAVDLVYLNFPTIFDKVPQKD